MKYEFMGWHVHFLRKIKTVENDCDDLTFYAHKMREQEQLSAEMIGDLEKAEASIRSSLALIEGIKCSALASQCRTVLEAAE